MAVVPASSVANCCVPLTYPFWPLPRGNKDTPWTPIEINGEGSIPSHNWNICHPPPLYRHNSGTPKAAYSRFLSIQYHRGSCYRNAQIGAWFNTQIHPAASHPWLMVDLTVLSGSAIATAVPFHN